MSNTGAVYGKEGTALHSAVTADFELDSDGARILDMACRTVDDLSSLEGALVGAPVMVPGSMGQERVNPLFAEVRATRALVGQLLGRLKLPDEDSASAKAEYNGNRARKAAGVRWGH
ncbi:hypothetical protein [Cryobacterium sp. CG_9.6]|uniref:hypothetical protein n=1 Tax=Cryobacterium sp. CG_9.6 TaxID=2760710 RepID=UPI002473A4BE|nr:hypothetical protein [Cryobacterium sp. CG_9.6]MDH6237051.1 hypothetical protein [Cryobacterium sp. CG_9.6]